MHQARSPALDTGRTPRDPDFIVARGQELLQNNQFRAVAKSCMGRSAVALLGSTTPFGAAFPHRASNSPPQVRQSPARVRVRRARLQAQQGACARALQHRRDRVSGRVSARNHYMRAGCRRASNGAAQPRRTGYLRSAMVATAMPGAQRSRVSPESARGCSVR